MKLYHRRSVRLPEYNYAQNGLYYVTMNCHERKHLFGTIVDGKPQLNALGQIAENELLKSVEIREEISIDTYIIMPNHVHAIVAIFQPEGADGSTANRASWDSPMGEQPLAPTLRQRSLGAFVAGYKSAVTTKINRTRGSYYEDVWQRSFYEHIVRNDAELYTLRNYIAENPLRWELKREAQKK